MLMLFVGMGRGIIASICSALSLLLLLRQEPGIPFEHSSMSPTHVAKPSYVLVALRLMRSCEAEVEMAQARTAFERCTLSNSVETNKCCYRAKAAMELTTSTRIAMLWPEHLDLPQKGSFASSRRRQAR